MRAARDPHARVDHFRRVALFGAVVGLSLAPFVACGSFGSTTIEDASAKASERVDEDRDAGFASQEDGSAKEASTVDVPSGTDACPTIPSSLTPKSCSATSCTCGAGSTCRFDCASSDCIIECASGSSCSAVSTDSCLVRC